jgi:hypothetical protein
MPLEDAPRAVPARFICAPRALSPERLEARACTGRGASGKCPLFLCLIRPASEILLLKRAVLSTPSQKLQQAADKCLEKEPYYAKVGTSLPERAERRWERKGVGQRGLVGGAGCRPNPGSTSFRVILDLQIGSCDTL